MNRIKLHMVTTGIGLALLLLLGAVLPTVAAESPAGQKGATGIQPFGANLFTGNFLKTREDGLNPNYVVAPSDQVAVRTWGSVTINDVFTVDSQGNIFLPEIGPVHLEGVRNADLSDVVREQIGKTFSDNFEVYTNLVSSQPVMVYVTGLVNNPGRYAGTPADSLLYFLDLAGGIDPQLGSYRNIDILRDGRVLARVDLYEFILKGRIASPQLRDRDTILVHKRGPVIELNGNVSRPALIELKRKTFTGADVLAVIPQASTTTEVIVQGMRDGAPFNRTLSIAAFLDTRLAHGDIVTLREDGRAETMLVRLEGEFEGPSLLAVRRGSRLVDVLDHIPVDPKLANTDAIYLRRASVAVAQKDAINDALFRLERSALLALSGSKGEVEIRTQEAELMEKFAKRARAIDPLGRVVTSRDGVQQNIFLEPDDVIVIPRRTQVVRVSGEVMIFHAIAYRPGLKAADYIQLAGGYSDRADESRIFLHHPNAEVELTDPTAAVKPGDEIMVPPRIDIKYRQWAMDMLQVIYQIAISAKVALDL